MLILSELKQLLKMKRFEKRDERTLWFAGGVFHELKSSYLDIVIFHNTHFFFFSELVEHNMKYLNIIKFKEKSPCPLCLSFRVRRFQSSPVCCHGDDD